jgi:4-amino-4-deoxy-L-arabinose transferase-like glycosyltransferase
MTVRESDDLKYSRYTIATILAFAAFRILISSLIGLVQDEAYSVTIARQLSLSYFDHPPMHQWIAHFMAMAVGENALVRLPFILLFAGTGWLMFVLTRLLFNRRAGFVTIFCLNCTPFFVFASGAAVIPDGPLEFALAAAAVVVAKLFFGPAKSADPWSAWIALGIWLGLAGLSKYIALFFPIGLALFLALSPRSRHWLLHPAPYVGALVGLMVFSPVLLWNAQHDWISLRFQSGRALPGAAFVIGPFFAMIGGEFLMLTPWFFVPLVGGMLAALRRAAADERYLFLLCLGLPPIVFFGLVPLWGGGAMPHWTMTGWMFVFPLMGAWIVEKWQPSTTLRRLAIWPAAALVVIVGVVFSQMLTGWIPKAFPTVAKLTRPDGSTRDPSQFLLDWSSLREAPLLNGATGAPPSFVAALKWPVAGNIALALGPTMPVLVLGDGRSLEFLYDSTHFVGEDGVIIGYRFQKDALKEAFQPYFESLDEPQTVTIGRMRLASIDLVLIRAHKLLRPFPFPYARE